MRSCSLEDCTREVGLHFTITEKSVHRLVHMTSSYPYTQSSGCFSSEAALRILVRTKWEDALRTMKSLVYDCKYKPLTCAFCGYFYGPFVIELLEKGGEFACRPLCDGNKRSLPEESKLTIPPSKRITVDGVMSDQSPNQLYVPTTRNCASIDAWIPGIGAFQMTAVRPNQIRDGARNDLAKLGEGADKLYWLLPSISYHSFKKKVPHAVDQYAVLMPYPEHLPKVLLEEETD